MRIGRRGTQAQRKRGRGSAKSSRKKSSDKNDRASVGMGSAVVAGLHHWQCREISARCRLQQEGFR